jgi:hypothetical protein
MEAGQSVSFAQISAVIYPATIVLDRLVDVKEVILEFIRVMYEQGPVTWAGPHDVTKIVPQLQQLTVALQSFAANA